MSSEFPDNEEKRINDNIGLLRGHFVEEQAEAIESFLYHEAGSLSPNKREKLSEALYTRIAIEREIFLEEIRQIFLTKYNTLTSVEFNLLIERKKKEYEGKIIDLIKTISSKYLNL